jgi:formylglycine-generating enzyme required for sulfatase activity
MIIRRLILILVVVILMLVLLMSCSKKTTEPDDPESEPIVKEETRVIPSTTGNEIIEVSEDTVVLPVDTDIDLIQEGNIIVSAPTEAAPDGLLRKVISYEEQNGQLVVVTEHAKLEDVFDQLELKISRELKTSEIRSTEYHIDGIELIQDHKNPVVFSYNIDEIFHITDEVFMNIDGNLSLQMGYDADAIILPWPVGIRYVMAEGYVGHSSNLQISVNGGFNIYDRIPVVTHIFYPITLVIGGIPISFTPKVVIFLEIDAEGQASLTTSVSSSSNFLAGLEYNKPTWSAYNEKSVNFNYTPPDLSSALHARVGAGPQFELNFYGIAGPFVNCTGYMDIAANVDNDPWWVLSGGFNIDAGVKFKALGYVADYTLHDIIEYNSVIAEAEQRLVATPTFNPAGGTYSTTQNVALSCTTPSATIRYTTNGSDPTETSTQYSSPLSVSTTTTIKARAFCSGWTPSSIVSATYTIAPSGTVATPTFNPAGGTYTSAQNVTISCATSGATIRYTTNGSDPTETSTQYSSPLSVSTTTTIKARAFRNGWTPSSVATATYTITPSVTVATPTFNPAGGTYSTTQNVALSCTTPSATIRYTTNGNDPTESSTQYSSPISVSTTTTIKAKAFLSGWTPSSIASATYTIGGGTPGQMVLVPGGTFTMGRTTGSGWESELPTHSVTLNSFYMGKYEVTQSEWQAVMGTNPSLPSYGIGDNYPVYYVSWYAILKYCNLRSMAEGLTPVYTISGSTDPANWGAVPTSDNATWNAAISNWSANGYRLPTEAEWEYAARGATNTPDYLYSGSDDINAVAWYDGNNTPWGSKPVGSKAPNGLGLYDMSGNIHEWCWDWFGSYSSGAQNNPTGPVSGSIRVGRGGSWGSSANYCRVAYRDSSSPNDSYSSIGFRLCRAVL